MNFQRSEESLGRSRQLGRKSWFPFLLAGINWWQEWHICLFVLGQLHVSLSSRGKWKSRYLSLIGDTLYVFSRASAQLASAKVRLTPAHSIVDAQDETGLKFSFRLMKRTRVTLYLKVSQFNNNWPLIAIRDPDLHLSIFGDLKPPFYHVVTHHFVGSFLMASAGIASQLTVLQGQFCINLAIPKIKTEVPQK